MVNSYSTINESLLESSGSHPYVYPSIEVVSAIVSSINHPEIKKDITGVINQLIVKNSGMLNSLTVDSGKLNTYTGGDIDFGHRKKLDMQLVYSSPEHVHTKLLDGYNKLPNSLYYTITAPNGVDSSSTLGENPNQNLRCLTNSTWSKYDGSGYVNFIGSKFVPDVEKSSDYTCIENAIFKEQIILALPLDKNKSQISTTGDSHTQINALAFYSDEPTVIGSDTNISSDGKALYETGDGKTIVEVIFQTADQAFVDNVKARDGDSKLAVGNKIRTIYLYEKHDDHIRTKLLDGYNKLSNNALYYSITSPNGVDSSSTLGENPNQNLRCLTNSTWSKYDGSGYVNFIGSKFVPDVEKSSDYTCIENAIFKEQIILALPLDKNKSQISTTGDSHTQINALAFYSDEPTVIGSDTNISSDGKALYETGDGKTIVEVIFQTADQAFVDNVKARDGDSKLAVGNKIRTIYLYEKA